ncbi:MAG TPA: hypothetical protein VM260_27900 [Pirellula sp.]|nr:hypothetical protein [Pirellula sp.]
MTNNYWLVSCHESGHAIGSIVMGGRCDGLLLSADGGQAHCLDLIGDRNAFMVACGPAAESLSEKFDAPECTPVPFEAIANNPPETASRDFALWCGVADISGINRKCVSDSRVLALWAIEREDEPESWARRIEFVHRVAAEIVDKNMAKILRIARALYQRGVLTGTEIKQLYEEQNDI